LSGTPYSSFPEASLRIDYHGPMTAPTGPPGVTAQAGQADPAAAYAGPAAFADLADPAAPAGRDGAAGACAAPRRLRVDAERNRAAILAAAREVFAEQGLEAPLEEIAARAGVGIATLYRRFPTRAHLVAAALVEKVTQYAEAAEQALAVPDPWAGFTSFV